MPPSALLFIVIVLDSARMWSIVGRSWLGKKLLGYLEWTVPFGLIRN
jgi:hypothetical protein